MKTMPKPVWPQSTTADQDFDISIAAIENTFRKLNDIRVFLQTFIGMQTISRRLFENEFYSCVARKKNF